MSSRSYIRPSFSLGLQEFKESLMNTPHNSAPPSSPIQKYRPSLSSSQIAYIIHLAERELPRSQDATSILRSLKPFLVKIDCGGVEVSYTAAARPALLDQLGAYSTSELAVSKTAYNEGCYVKMKESSSSLSEHELECALEHKYLNDLMSGDEERQYEKDLEAEAEAIRRNI